VPNRSADVLRQRDLIKAGVERHGFDYGGGFTMFPRHTIALALLSFDRSDREQRQAVRELFPELIAEASALGYAPYRSHTAFMDRIAEQYDANDNALGPSGRRRPDGRLRLAAVRAGPDRGRNAGPSRLPRARPVAAGQHGSPGRDPGVGAVHRPHRRPVPA